MLISTVEGTTHIKLEKIERLLLLKMALLIGCGTEQNLLKNILNWAEVMDSREK